jgi:hypothetical protein
LDRNPRSHSASRVYAAGFGEIFALMYADLPGPWPHHGSG